MGERIRAKDAGRILRSSSRRWPCQCRGRPQGLLRQMRQLISGSFSARGGGMDSGRLSGLLPRSRQRSDARGLTMETGIGQQICGLVLEQQRRTPADQAELQIGSELRKWKRFKRGSHRRPMWSIKRSWQGSGCMMGPTAGPQPSSIDLPLPQLLRPASRGLHHRRLRRDSAEYQLRKGCCGVVEESFDSRSSKHLVGTALTCRRRKALLDSSRQRRGGIWRGRWIG